MLAGCPAQLTASVFNRLDQYASSPSNRAYCCAELAVCFLALAKPSLVLVASTHGGLARLSCPGWLVYVPKQHTRDMVTHLSVNRASHVVSALICAIPLSLSQAFTFRRGPKSKGVNLLPQGA